MYFEWKDEFSINIKEIDEQHKKMFAIGKRLADIILSNSSFDDNEINTIFKELKAYTKYHFSYEEHHMLESGYPFYETHRNQHEALIKRIQDIESKNSGNFGTETLMVLIDFVFEWITSHILKSDFKYRDYIRHP